MGNRAASAIPSRIQIVMVEESRAPRGVGFLAEAVWGADIPPYLNVDPDGQAMAALGLLGRVRRLRRSLFRLVVGGYLRA